MENVPEITNALDFPFNSYEEYVQKLSIIQPEYRWLSAVLSFGSPCSSETTVILLDSSNDQLQTSDLTGVSRKNLVETLSARHENMATRLLIVSCLQAWSIDRDVVAAIGETYGVDPVFFWQTFDHYYAKNDRNCHPEMRNRWYPADVPTAERTAIVGCMLHRRWIKCSIPQFGQFG